MTRNEIHVHDISTLANFKDWAQSIGAALAAFGWIQTADTGQVNWSTILSVPTSGNYVYEIWKPGDGGTAFYIRIDYGNNGGSSPAIKIQGGTSTNGSGTLSGDVTTTSTPATSANTGSTLFNCLYCGDSSSFSIMLWRDASSSFNNIIAVDRSRNSSGAVTNSYFNVFTTNNTSATNSPYWQQSVVFGVGASTATAISGNHTWNVIIGGGGSATSSFAFGGNIAVTPVFPLVGYYDNPTLTIAMAGQADFSELAVVNMTLLGSSHNYVFSNNKNFAASNGLGVLMRWE